MKPHLPIGWTGGFIQSKRGNWFEGRHWAICWCGLDQSAKVHKLARVRKAKRV